MSSGKKDLTRIEDLGEFIHELNSEETLESSDDFPSDLPDLPTPDDEEITAFETDDSATDIDFGTTEEFPTSFSGEQENSENDFSLEETPEAPEAEEFSTSDFTASFDTDFSTSDFESPKEDEPEHGPEEEATVEDDFPYLNDEAPETDSVQFDMPEETQIIQPEVREDKYQAPETFEDLKKFSENSSFSSAATEANPSFSLLIKNVRYLEDVQDIIVLLKELNLLVDNEEQTKSRLMRGMLLVPRISEYAAIFLAHKLRRFDIDIQLGLSDEIHPPKHQEAPETGIVSKHSLYQNQNHYFHFDNPKLELSQIIVSAAPTLEGYQVVKYIGVASEHKMLESPVVEDEGSTEVPAHYQELAQKLKAHALKANSNAVVGLNYQLTPIPADLGMGGHKYRLTCTGNLVWINKL